MDKFNDIWKDRFNQGDIPDADWNTPDTEVWAAILPHVPNKRDRRSLLVWIILGLCLLGILAISYFYVAQSTITENRLPATTEQPVLTFTEQNSSELAISQTTVPLTSKSSVSKNTIAPTPVTQHQRVKKLLSTQPPMDKALQGRTESRGIDRLKPEDGKSVMDDLKTERALIKEQSDIKANDALLSPLHFIPTLLLPIESEESLFVPSPVKQVPLDLPRQKKFKIVVQIGALFWQHRISDQYTSDLSAFDFNYSDSWGWSLNAGAAYQLGDKFALIAGFSYEQIETYSGHNSNLSYDPTLEDGQAINDYDATLATPYGTAGASFRFAREEELGDEAVDLLVDFHSSHTIQNVSIPLGLQYFPLGQQSKWMPSVNIGVGTNYLFGLSNKLERIETNHSAIKYLKSGEAQFADPNIDRFHFDVRAGMGLDYRIASDLRLGVQGAWARGLNPIFEQDNYQTRINRYQIQMRISKQF